MAVFFRVDFSSLRWISVPLVSALPCLCSGLAWFLFFALVSWILGSPLSVHTPAFSQVHHVWFLNFKSWVFTGGVV